MPTNLAFKILTEFNGVLRIKRLSYDARGKLLAPKFTVTITEPVPETMPMSPAKVRPDCSSCQFGSVFSTKIIARVFANGSDTRFFRREQSPPFFGALG
jgi:hypothetical protein